MQNANTEHRGYDEKSFSCASLSRAYSTGSLEDRGERTYLWYSIKHITALVDESTIIVESSLAAR
eukprot:scaffold95415_cov51-Attheya_sp.AAC.1